MSYSNPNVELTYNGNGSDQTFSVNFHYLEGVTEVIQVELWDYTDPTLPVKESFVLDVDYTIDESGYPNTEVSTTDPVPVDYKLLVYRSSEAIQTSNFVNGAFPAESVEEGLDKATMVAQELTAKMDRAILNPIHNPDRFDIDDLIDLDNTVTDHETRLDTAEAVLIDHEDRIEANETAIANHGPRIEANEDDIAILQTQIGSLTPAVIVGINAGATHNAANAEIIIVDTIDPVAVALPAATNGYLIRVKLSEKIASKTITSAEGIDGFGLTYTVSSEYESLSLVSDGTKWYII